MFYCDTEPYKNLHFFVFRFLFCMNPQTNPCKSGSLRRPHPTYGTVSFGHTFLTLQKKTLLSAKALEIHTRAGPKTIRKKCKKCGTGPGGESPPAARALKVDAFLKDSSRKEGSQKVSIRLHLLISLFVNLVLHPLERGLVHWQPQTPRPSHGPPGGNADAPSDDENVGGGGVDDDDDGDDEVADDDDGDGDDDGDHDDGHDDDGDDDGEEEDDDDDDDDGDDDDDDAADDDNDAVAAADDEFDCGNAGG